MTRIKGILFDKDGTLFDFSTTWEAWAAAFLQRIARDATHAQELGAAIGFDAEKRAFDPGSIVIAGTPDEVTQALLPNLPGLSHAALIDILNAEAEHAPQAEAAPLRPLLQALRDADLCLGVVTNDAETPARAHLDGAGVTQMFDFIAGFDSGFGAKPEPGQLLAFADAVGLLPAQIVMVGDSLHDLVAAQRAGMRGVGVLTGLAGSATLAPHAEVVLPDIGHLPRWLASQNLPTV